jgi:UPF0271 protein
MRVDLNSDVGESFGPWRLGETEELLGIVTSANVACAFHAGDPRVMEDVVRRAAQTGTGIGAHVGYPDLVGFGRRAMDLSHREIVTDVLYQIGALYAFCRSQGVPLRHVKAHGALYNQGERDLRVARALVEGVARARLGLVLVAPEGSAMAQAAQEWGVPVAREAFCDRAYRADGTLVPRREAGAVRTDPAEVVEQAVRLATQGKVRTIDGQEVQVGCDTLCIHGDTPGAAALARAVRSALEAAGVEVRPFPGPGEVGQG